MKPSTEAPALFGRERDVGTLRELLDGVRDRGGSLIVRGEAGVGKSALLALASEEARARGYQVLTTTGVECETELPFAELYHLLRPRLEDVGHLPAPQRAAVEAAFGMADAPAPELFLIALATLHLLSDAAAETPILLLAEDAQWLDRPTADVLAFVARRLDADPIAMVAAIREGYQSPLDAAGIPELRLEGLGEEEARALLDAQSPDLHPAVRERLLEEAEGNPLALVELPAALRADDVTDALLPARLPLTTRLERAFSARASELPTMARTALIVAAADDGGFLAEILAAVNVLTLAEHGDEVLTPAIVAGLVKLAPPYLRFHHPLVRSAIYQSASAEDRRAAHSALARVLADQPYRRAWHRASSILGPHEEVAAELDQAAARAQRRGAIAVAINALERAAALSAEPSARARRLLQASEQAFDLGRFHVAARLLQEAERIDMDSRERLRVILIKELFNDGVPAGEARVPRLLELAGGVGPEDIDLALGLLRAAAMQCWWTDPDDKTRRAVVTAAEQLPIDAGDPRILAIRAIADPIRQAGAVIDHLAGSKWDAAVDPSVTRLFGQAAFTVGDMERAAFFIEAASGGLREQGRLGLLAPASAFLAWAQVGLGNLAAAASAADEAARLTRETEQSIWVAAARGAAGMTAALRGRLDDAEEIAREVEALPVSAREASFRAVVPLIRGVAAIAGGRYADAYEHLCRLFDRADPAYHYQDRWRALGYLAEAGAHSEHRQAARAVVDQLEPVAAQTPAPGVQIYMRYARAVLAEDERAEALFAVALSADLSHWPFERGRLLLAYGTWLRRQRRLAESRTPLRAARNLLDTLGAIPWSERARQELNAAGETSRKRHPQAWDHLTPQELQIAQMAAEGLSNREIGQRLYLSHRTVGSHLYHIFPKLGIASRAQLHQALSRVTA